MLDDAKSSYVMLDLEYRSTLHGNIVTPRYPFGVWYLYFTKRTSALFPLPGHPYKQVHCTALAQDELL